jgi:type I restriction enzyme M protein
MKQTIGAGIITYESDIWKTADTLRGCAIKESDWPGYMMPFFALMLVESRIRRLRAEKVAEYKEATGQAFDDQNPEHLTWLDMSVKAAGKGYHQDLVMHGKGLKETCQVPGGNFLNRFTTHLEQYDPETRRLLGMGYVAGLPKFLDIQGKALSLWSMPNQPLYAFAQKWGNIDLTGFDNSEVTTIEEHIKRKWADISAETAGEQYTPSDVIDLASALIVELFKEGKDTKGIADVYDMTCGGGNFVYAMEDSLRKAFPKLSVRARGQELNDALYALAAIEARFRSDAKIEWGNTLTDDRFLGDKFDAIMANPPYGVDWKDFKTTIEADASGRFAQNRLPPTSDGQLLFLQHAAFHLKENGVATIVHSGSTLFSGDAGGGESETRRWLLQEQDMVEAIIQLPKNEFFNTGISTYLWVLNKNKPKARKGRVLLINAENNFVKLKKNLNKKNCKIDEANCAQIVQAFHAYTDGPISKVLTVDQLLYNKVEIILHRHDEAGRAVQEEQVLAGDVITVTIDGTSHVVKDGPLDNPVEFSAKEAAAKFNEAIKLAETITVQSGNHRYTRDNGTGEIQLIEGKTITALGLGNLTVKAKVAKAKGEEVLKVEVTLGPLKEKDTETTAYASDAKANEKIIADFLATWVKEPFERVAGGVKVGCEINFNKQFPKQSEVRPVKELLNKLHKLNTQSAELAAAFDASMGVTNTDKLTKLMMSTLSLPIPLPTAPQSSPIPGRGGKRIATRGSH